MRYLMRFYFLWREFHLWQIIVFLKTSFLLSYIAESQIRGDVIENQDDIVDNVAVSDVQAQTSAAGSENSLITSVEEEEGGTHLQKNGNVPNPTGESAIASPKETTTKGLLFCFLLFISCILKKKFTCITNAIMIGSSKFLCEF